MIAEDLKQKIETQLQSHPIVLYMKGDRVFPQCGFSARVIEILESLKASYETHDILEDPEIRSGLKEYAQWPTFPQLYIKGELVGGCDIVTSLYQSGELSKLVSEATSK